MAEETPQYHPQFEAEVNSAVVGEKNVIYNYFYSSQAPKAVLDQAAIAADESLPCPYRGLFHFGPGDEEYFFGRTSVVETLVQVTQTRPFIPLLGASGSGKSSVVLAGLVPKLQQAGHWQFTHFRPGSDPFYGLALALVPLYTTYLNETERIAQARQLANYLRQGEILLADVFAQIQHNFPNDRVLLIADQFEELYTLCAEEGTRRRFLDTFIHAFFKGEPSPAVGAIARLPRLVLTMRADFLDNALSYRPFADILQQNPDLKLGPMNQEELTDVIAKPAETLGVAFEAGLVERMLKDVEAEPGALPLLEFALTELWQRRQGKQLTHVAYTAIGEVHGALARHADASYGKLTPTEQQQMRRIFIQLVRPGEEAEDTRRLATKAELGEHNWALVKQLADDRLVVTNRSEAAQVETVEVVHEALIRHWGELRGWMETDRDFRAWQERLRGGMAEWRKTRDEGSLLRGAALAQAEEKLKERRDDFGEGEGDFIQHSLQARENLEKVNAARRRREIRTAWGITGGSLAALVVSGSLGVMAWQQTKQAELNQANSLGRYAQSLFNEGKELDAFVQAIKAVKTLQKHHATDPEVMRVLKKAIYEGSERNRLEGHTEPVDSVSFSPDGKTLATGSQDKTIKLWNIETGKELLTLKGHDDEVRSVSFSPDGKTLATGSRDTTIKLWDVATGKEIRTLTGHTNFVRSVSFSPDGKTLATGSDDQTVKLWDVETGKELPPLQGHTNFVRSASFSSDGKTLATGSDDQTVKLWDVETRTEIRTLQGHTDSVKSVSFSPDGKTLATGGDDKTIKIWNVATGKEIRTFKGHNDVVRSVSFSPDGKTLATGSDDKTIKLWDVATDRQLRPLKGHNDFIFSVSFSPDGKTLATGSRDKTIKIWNVATGKEIRTLKHRAFVSSVSFSPNGKMLASGSDDRTVKLWTVATGQAIRTFEKYRDVVRSVSFSPDGKTLATGSRDKTIKLWNVQTDEEIHTLKGHDAGVTSVSFSPDGKTLATGSNDKTIKLWNVHPGREIRTFRGHDDYVNSVSFSPDGKTLATGSDDKTIRLWNVYTGREVNIFEWHDAGVTSVSFSPDGKTLATGSKDDTIKLWTVNLNLNLDYLIGRSCDWVSNYLTNDPQVSESDKHLCDGIGSRK